MKQSIPTSTYILRLLGGGYLSYLGLSLMGSDYKAVAIVFCLVGISLCVLSFRNLREAKLLEAQEVNELEEKE